MKKALKQQIMIFLSTVLLIDVALYFAYMLGAVPKSVFYGVGVFMPLLLVWIFLVLPYVIIRKCEKCGSKNIHPIYPRERNWFGIACDDCGHVFKSSIHNTKVIISAIIPFSFFGLCFLLGSVLAGEVLGTFLAFFGILLSVWFPSALAEIIFALKLSNSKFGQEHQTSTGILMFIQFFVVPFIMLIGYGMIIKLLWTGTI